LDNQGDIIRIPTRARDFSVNQKSRQALKNKPPFQSVQGRFYCTVEWTEREHDHSPLCSSKDRNEWSYNPHSRVFPNPAQGLRNLLYITCLCIYS